MVSTSCEFRKKFYKVFSLNNNKDAFNLYLLGNDYQHKKQALSNFIKKEKCIYETPYGVEMISIVNDDVDYFEIEKSEFELKKYFTNNYPDFAEHKFIAFIEFTSGFEEHLLDSCDSPELVKIEEQSDSGHIVSITYPNSAKKENEVYSFKKTSDAEPYADGVKLFVCKNNELSPTEIDFVDYCIKLCKSSENLDSAILESIYRSEMILDELGVDKTLLAVLQNPSHTKINLDNAKFIPNENWSKDTNTGKGYIEYPDGNKYEGDFVDSKRTGKGVYTWKSGNKYEGDFVKNKRTGKGIYTWKSGNKYEGDFIADKRTGKGVFTYADGDIYEGDFVDNKMSGKGIFTWKSGDKFEGNFIDGDFDKKGIITFFDWRYEGEHINLKPNGKGVLTFEDGRKYEGDFVDGNFEGKGKYSWPDGDKYEGDYSNGKRSGKGIFTWKSGNKYKGDFVDSKRTGKGVYTWTNGEKYEGDFVDGECNGKGLYQWPNKNLYEGDFIDNKITGKGIYTYENGDSYDGEFLDGRFNGTGKYIWSDGDKYEGVFKNQIPESISSEFIIDNKPKIFSNDIKNILVKESVGSLLLEKLSKRKSLGDLNREILDFKLTLAKSRAEHNADNGHSWIDKFDLSSKNFNSEMINCLFKDKDETIRIAIANNPSLGQEQMSELLMDEDLNVKINVLKNPSFKQEAALQFIKKSKSNYVHSILRKSIALNPSSSKTIIESLLKDKFRWVREAAATSSTLSDNYIEKNLKTDDRYILKGYLLNPNCSAKNKNKIETLIQDEDKYPIETNIYKLGFNCNVYPAERVYGTVSIENIAECIVDYEGDWANYVWDNNWYDFNDLGQSYGMSDVATDVEYPDGEILPIKIKVDAGSYEDDDFDIWQEEGFVCSGVSYEKGYGWGSWYFYEAELEYELKPDYIKPYFDGEICDGYDYESHNLDGSIESTSFESNGEYSTEGKGTDFDINVDIEEMMSEMEESGVNVTDEEQVQSWLKDSIKDDEKNK